MMIKGFVCARVCVRLVLCGNNIGKRMCSEGHVAFLPVVEGVPPQTIVEHVCMLVNITDYPILAYFVRCWSWEAWVRV